jgi:hypothetical protein
MRNTKPERNKSKSIVWFWLWGFAAIAAGVLVGIGILFWHTPRAYKPVRTKTTEHVSLYLTHELGPEFHNQIQREKPFELIIPQSELNDIISQEFQPQQFGDMSFFDPYVIFSDQSILLMGTLIYEGVSSVISITALPTMDSDGNINMNIQSVRLGMVPVTTLVTKLAQKTLDDNRSSFEGDAKAEENVQAIIRNEPFDPIFLFSTEYCEYWVRISKFSLRQGSLKLTLLPKEV